MSRPKLYIIPGFGETARFKNYRDIINFAKKKYNVIPVKIQWFTNVPFETFTNEAETQIESMTSQDILLGFSFGAIIANQLALNKKIKSIYMCSLAPYFTDDLELISTEAKEYFGKEMVNSFKKMEFKVSDMPVHFFVGNKEPLFSINRTNKSFEKWKKTKTLDIIEGAEHELKNKQYSEAVIKKLDSESETQRDYFLKL